MSGRDLFESIINFRPTHKPPSQDKPQAEDSRNRPRDMAAHPLLAIHRHDPRRREGRQIPRNPARPGARGNPKLDAGWAQRLSCGLKPPPAVCQATKEYQREMNTVGQWVEAMCEKSTIARSFIFQKFTRNTRSGRPQSTGGRHPSKSLRRNCGRGATRRTTPGT
jgi:hypothetical protein